MSKVIDCTTEPAQSSLLTHRFRTGKGLVVFTGCSHGGVVNAAKSALELTRNAVPLYAIIGGYHLANSADEIVAKTVQDLVKLDPQILLPGHCSGWRVKHEIETAMPTRLCPCTVGTKFVF